MLFLCNNKDDKIKIKKSVLKLYALNLKGFCLQIIFI